MKNYYYLTASILACILSSTVQAGGSGSVYLGGTYGATYTDNDKGQMDNGNICSGAGVKDQEDCFVKNDDSAYHIYGGFNVTHGLAVEAGYVDLGTTAHYEYTDPIAIEQETKGITVTGVARHRLGQTSPVVVYGKAGAVRWSSEASGVISDNDGTSRGTRVVKQNGISPTVGAGVEYEVNNNVSLRAGWDRYYNVGEEDTLLDVNQADRKVDLNTLDTDVDVLSAGVNYYFF